MLGKVILGNRYSLSTGWIKPYQIKQREEGNQMEFVIFMCCWYGMYMVYVYHYKIK